MVAAMSETMLAGLVASLVDSRHVGGYSFKVPERVLHQFAQHCQREGYAEGTITKEAVDGFLYGSHLRSSTIRRNEVVLRHLADYAQALGWEAYTPAARTKVRLRHQPPYVFTEEEVRRLFAAIDSQTMSSYTNKALVDPVLFRVLYGAGLRISEALNLRLPDVDTHAGTLQIRDSKIPHFTGGPHPHSLRHGFAVANLRRWAAHGADLSVMLPYLACYMGHADLRGTQYYLRLTADAYPEVIAKAQIRFGYVIPAPPEEESSGSGTRSTSRPRNCVWPTSTGTGFCSSFTGWKQHGTARQLPATSA